MKMFHLTMVMTHAYCYVLTLRRANGDPHTPVCVCTNANKNNSLVRTTCANQTFMDLTLFLGVNNCFKNEDGSVEQYCV